MSRETVSLSYFVSHYPLPAAVRVLSGCGQLEEGDEVTLQSVQSARGVEVLRGRHGDRQIVSFIPFEYNGVFELIVASSSQPWASYLGFPTVGSIISSGTELPIAVKTRNAWRGSTESSSVYQNDILTSLMLKVDGTGRSFLEAINQRGTAVYLQEAIRGDFTTDLSDVHWSIEEIVKLFESKFPVRIRLRATPGKYDTVGTVGDIFTLLHVMVRQEVEVIGVGDNFTVIADDAVDVVKLDSSPAGYFNLEPIANPSPLNHYVDQEADEPLYTSMSTASPEAIQDILRSHFADHASKMQDLNETIDDLQVKLENEQSKNKQLEMKKASLERQLQALKHEEVVRQHTIRDNEIRSLEATVEQLQMKNSKLEYQLCCLQEEQAQLKQLNHDLNETVISMANDKEAVAGAKEGSCLERQVVSPEQTNTRTDIDDTQATAKRSTVGTSSPTPKPREKISRSSSNPPTPPIPPRRPIAHSSPACPQQPTPPTPTKRKVRGPMY